MLWKFVWTLGYLFSDSPVSKRPVDQDVRVSFNAAFGPQSSRELDQAHKALYSESDMVFPRGYSASNGPSNMRYRWPGFPGSAEVPYVIDSSLTQQRQLIQQAMEQYNRLTCARFVPRTSQRDYINIRKGNRCKSVVGRQSGQQDLLLGDGCFYIGTIVHELGHALGLLHEHQRSDRDSYITVYRRNITRGQESNFNKTPSNRESHLPRFNYNSIMIYGNYAFSKQRDMLMTMEAKNGELLQDPYNKPGLDDVDIEKVNRFYQC